MTELDPDDKNVIVRGPDGDPLPDPRGTRMIERESYERVIEGLKMAADACMHLRKHEPQHQQTWADIGLLLDKIRKQACELAGLDIVMQQLVTEAARGNPYPWRQARDRFLDGIRQATGGMRQLATCFRGDFKWSLMAQELERHEVIFRQILLGNRRMLAPTPELAAQLRRRQVRTPKLILPTGFAR